MLPIDSLVIDVIFKASAQPKPQELVAALGGETIIGTRKILDPDMQDPRFEMELSPSLPFRRRGERRLMIIDDSVAPMREDPRDPIVPVDLRTEKQRLIDVCKTGMVRLGRLNALGSWGDAVMVAESARDLRGIALLHWVLDPQMDVSGNRRASRLSQAEFEEKVLAFEKRLDELSDDDILAHLGPVNFTRDGDLLILDVLENDGTWDVRKSILMEDALAAMDRFSIIPGAPAAKKDAAAGKKEAPPPKKEAAPPAPPAPEPAGPPLRAQDVNGNIVLIFPRERFDLDVAAAIGKRDWDTVLSKRDLDGAARDKVYRGGARFIAPLEFLSEVFYEGKPLTKPEFEKSARSERGARVLEVHLPRFGPVLLVDVAGRGRFISSLVEEPGAVVSLVQ